MKKILLVFGLLASLQSVYAQSYEVKWSPTKKMDQGYAGFFDIIDVKSDHYFTLVRPKGKYSLLKYDLNHKLVSKKELDLTYKGKDLLFNKIIDTKKGKFGFMNFYDRKSKEWKIFKSSYNENNFSKPEEVYSRKFEKKFKIALMVYAKNTDNDVNNIVVSKDKSKIAYSNLLFTKDLRTDDQLVIAVFDENANLVWEKSHHLEYPDKKLTIVQTVVSNDGNVYLLGKFRLRKKVKGLPRFEYSVFKVSEDKIQEYDVDIGTDLAPTDMTLYMPDANSANFVMAGFYTDSERKSELKGIFFAKGDDTKGLHNIKIHKFQPEFLEDLVSEKSIEEEVGLNESFNIDKPIHFTDGSLGFIAENYFVTTITRMSGNGDMRVSEFYNSNSIVIPRFTTDGDLIDIQKIPKEFRSFLPGYTSYAYAVSDEKVILVFNDFKNKEERKEKKGKKRSVYTDLVAIDLDSGKINFNKTLFNSTQTELDFNFNIFDFNNEYLLIGAKGKKKYSIGKIELK
ncbi:MAG: hypothetical protein AB8F74_21245 [Saprospiraceae bacterium]